MLYGLSWLDWSIVLACTLGATALGLRFTRQVRTLDDHAIGHRRFGKTLLTLFVLSSSTTGDQVAGSAGAVFRVGLGGFWYPLLNLMTLPFQWFVAPLLRRARVPTMASFFELRFSTAAATIYALFGLGVGVFYLATGLLVSSHILTGLTDGMFPTRSAVLAVSVLFVIYTSLGGLGAGITAAGIQGLLTIVLSLILLPVVFHRVGGLEGLHAGAALLHEHRPGLLTLAVRPETAAILERPPLTAFFVVMMFVTGLVSLAVNPMGMLVCGAARTESDAQLAVIGGNLLKRLCSVAWAFIGLACAVIYLTPERIAEFAAQPALEKEFATKVFGLAARDLLTPVGRGCIGLLIAALLSTMMSTGAAYLAMTNALWVVNIYRRLLRPSRSENHYLAVARLSAPVIAAGAAVLGIWFERLLPLMEILISAPIGVGVAFWLGITWRRFTSAGMIAAVLGGWATWVFLEWQGGAGLVNRFFPSIVTVIKGKLEVDDGWIMLSYLVTSVTFGICVSLLTQPDPRDKIERFHGLLQNPVQGGKLPPIVGFAAACAGAALIVGLTWWLAKP